MKVLAINGSPKKNGNTAFALQTVLGELERAGIQTETVHVGIKAIRGCIACGSCARSQDSSCALDDGANEWIKKMIEAEGIVIGSPVYYAGINGTLKSFLDRAFYVAGANGRKMRHKVGAGVVVARRGGTTASLDQLNKYFTIAEMLMPSSNYWNMIHGAAPNEATGDLEGVQTMRVLGQNMAWLLKVLDYAKGHVPEPEAEQKVFTNFIR